MRICCGSTYVTTFYASYEEGVYTSFPTMADFMEAVRWASSVGFNAMELELLSWAHLRKIMSNVEMFALPPDFMVPSVSFPFVFSSFGTRASWSRVERDFHLCLEATAKFGAKILNMTSPPYPGSELAWDGPYPGGPPTGVVFHREMKWKDAWETLVSRLGSLCDSAGSEGMKLAIEPRPREMVSNTDSMLMLLRDVESTRLGALFDTGHHFVMKEVLPISIWKLGLNIIGVHLSDNDGVIEHHWAPGEGRIDWPAVIEALRASRFTGHMAIESSGMGRNPSDFVRAKSFIERLISPGQLAGIQEAEKSRERGEKAHRRSELVS